MRYEGTSVRPSLRRAAIAIMLLPIAVELAAQPTFARSGAPTCQSCSVELVRELTLEQSATSDGITTFVSIVRRSDGWYYVAERSRILVYNPVGKLMRTFGKAGDGPGEFRSITSLRLFDGDSLLIRQPRRLTIYGPNEQYVRSVILTGSVDGLEVLGHGKWIAATTVRPGGESASFKILSTAGDTLQRFGSVDSFIQDCPTCASRIVAAARPGAIWASARNEYALQYWVQDTRGEWRPERRLVFDGSPWFRKWYSYTRPGERPGTSIVQLAPIDSRQRLVVLGTAASLSWQPSPAQVTSAGVAGGVVMRPRVPSQELLAAEARNRASVIDIINTAANTVVSSTRFDGRDLGLIDGTRAVELRHDVNGLIQVDIWRIIIPNE